MKKPPTTILSRCDRIGDLVLSLPALGLLRDAGISRRILHCLPYCRDIADWARFNDLCEDVFIDGETPPVLAKGQPSLGIALFHGSHSAKAFRQLDLDWTLGPRSKLSALWSYDRSVPQHRSRVRQSEMQYNLDLVRETLEHEGIAVPDFQGLPALKVPPDWQSPVVASHTVLVVANRGSAENWPIEKYIAYGESALQAGHTVDFLVSGNEALERRAAIGRSDLETRGARVVGDFSTLRELIVYLNGAQNVVSSSTGPLHLAHALGKNVLGIYPTARVRSFDRWRPHGYWHQGEVRFIEIE